jgi:hypothetical protein
MDLKPRLSGENSIIASLATVALVFGIYNAKVGPVSDVHATEAMDGNIHASIRKAGWSAVIAVAAVTLLAKDPNIGILGGATIIAEELSYRHALMTNPGTGQIQVSPASYQSAGGATVTDLGQYSAAVG